MQHDDGHHLIAGRYRLDHTIGSGGQGAVYAATDMQLGRPVAVKRMAASHDEVQRQRFYREAQLAKGLTHPHTVRVLDFGQDASGQPFIVYELLTGKGLDVVLRGGPLPPERVARIGQGVLKSLMEAHQLGIVHRDIKPANIFLCDFAGEPEFVKVLDFGIARTSEPAQRTLTQSGFAVGTPQYMAPEQVHGAEVGPSADLYALGLTMAEMLSGRALIQGATPAEIAAKQISDEQLMLPREVLQSDLGAVIHRATRKSHAQRFQAAEEMLAALGQPVSASSGAMHAQVGSATAVGPGVPLQSPTNVSARVGAAPTGTAPPKKAPKARWMIALVLAFVIIVPVAVVLVTYLPGSTKSERTSAKSKSKNKSDKKKKKRKKKKGSAAGPAAAPKKPAAVPWDGGQLLVGRVDADDVADVVGYCRDSQRDLAVCAVSGKTLEILWQTKGLKVRHVPSLSWLLLAPSHVFYVEGFEGTATVLDRTTGKQLRSIETQMRSDDACVPTEQPNQVWLSELGIDKREMLVDLTTGKMTPAGRPKTCTAPPRHASYCFASGSMRRRKCSSIPVPTRLNGMEPSALNFDTKHGAVLGYEDSSRNDMIAGYEVLPNLGGRILWTRAFNEPDATDAVSRNFRHFASLKPHAVSVADGRIYAISASSLAAFDARTGKTLWRHKHENLEGVVANGERLFVADKKKLHLRKVSDGSLLTASAL